MRLHLILGAAGIGAAFVIGIGANQHFLPPMKAFQVKVAQSNLGLVVASPDKNNTDRMAVASVKTPLRPVPDAEGVERADDQPLMATGLDLNGLPKRFPAKEILGNLEIPGF